MARDGSGTYTRVSNSFTVPVAGTTISPTDADTFWDELDAEITDSLSRSGKGGMSADLDMNNNDINEIKTAVFQGSTSGTTTVVAPAIAGTVTATLPSVSGTFAITGDKLSAFAATTSLELKGVISDETGSGALVFATSPTLVTPALGTPSAAVLTNATGLPLSGLTAQAAYTIVANNSGSSAIPTAIDVSAITLKAAPVSADIVLIQDSEASNAFKRTTAGALSTVGSVASFNARTGAVTPAAGDYTYSGNTVALPTKYWSGGTHSNNVGTPNTKVDVAAGVWRDSTDALNIIGTAKTIDFSVNGAVDRLDTGTIAAATRYYTFAIAKADGTMGTLASLSATAPTLPATYVYFRRIGMVKTAAGGATILPFTHLNNAWYYSTAVRDITSAAMTANTVTAKVLASVPFVQGVTAIFAPTIIPASGTSIVFDVMPGFLPDTAVTGWRQDFEGLTALQFVLRIPVDSSGQIKYRAGTVNHTLTVDVAGWIDDL